MPLISIDFPFQPPRGVGLRAMTLSSTYSNLTDVERSHGGRDSFL
jgi:hypothetical protein